MLPDPIQSLSTAATLYARSSADWLEQCLDCLVHEIIARAAEADPLDALDEPERN
jgi:hypothetical protein